MLPSRVVQRAEVDSAAFNRSVLPQSAATEAPRIIMPLPEAKLTGITTTLSEMLQQHPPPLRPDGLPIIPYDWQVEDIEALIQWSRVGVFLPVGSGKTFILTYTALAWGRSYYVVVLPPILIRQWVKWLNEIPGAGGAVGYKGTLKQRSLIDLMASRWWIMSYGIFRNDYDKLLKLLHKQEYGLIVDECFPAGTQVLTPEGTQDIETLRAGELVLTSYGPQSILHVFHGLAYELVTLELTDGRCITCTPNHPVFTDRGWVAAHDCEDRWLLSSVALRDVQRGVQKADELASLHGEASRANGASLLQILRSDSKNAAEARERCSFAYGDQEGRVRMDSTASETLERGTQSSNFGKPEGRTFQAPRGQRYGANPCRESFDGLPAVQGLQMEPRDFIRPSPTRISDQLQSGLRQPADESSFRSGWEQSSFAQGARREKGTQAPRVGVARVSRHQLSSPVPVYNLEVENCPHYFAEGVLVHNCHNLKNTESQNFKLAMRFSAGQNIALATGTELNDPADAYAYVKIKTPGIYQSYGHFKRVHVGSEDFFGEPSSWVNLDIMNRNLYLQSVQRTKEEVQKHLPRAKYMPLEYPLDAKHLKLYHELGEQQLLLLADGGKIDATSTQNLYHHMQQIINNPQDYGLDMRPACYDVIDMLLEQLDFENLKAKRKFIIWTWYQQTTERVRDYLQSRFPGRVCTAYGKSNSDKEFASFKDDPEKWFMVAQPLSAGAGVEPQYVCYNCLFLETPTRSIAFRQAAGRLDRDGQSESANIWIGIAEGTVQETLYQNLLRNDELVQKVQKNPIDIRKMIYGDGVTNS